MLPTQELLEKVSQEIRSVPNRRKESKRGVHYGLFLLGYKSGLRISEAVRFDLTMKNKQGLYRIEKPKGKNEWFVYVSKEVVRELKEGDWKPNQTNRWNFYHFLRKIKRELNVSESMKLTPHNLRRAFTTYQAEKGMPLPLLQKLLGHSSIRTTALYWQNIHGDNDLGDILAGKKWLENRKEPEPARPLIENFPKVPKNPEPIFIDQRPVIPNKKNIQQDNSLAIPKLTKKTPELVSGIFPERQVKIFLNNNADKRNDQLKISQPLALNPNKREKMTEKELVLLQKIKVLEQQLAQIQTENSNLKVESKYLKMLITEAKIIQLPPFKGK